MYIHYLCGSLGGRNRPRMYTTLTLLLVDRKDVPLLTLCEPLGSATGIVCCVCRALD